MRVKKDMRSRTKAGDLTAARILRACANGAIETRVVHQSSPNSVKMISYLILIDEGLIDVVDEGFRIVHKATPRGLERMEKLERQNADADKLMAETEICPHVCCY